MNGNVVSRSMHEAGLAVWFGGTLAGAVGFNGGAAAATNSSERTAIADAAWSKWAPINAVAIGAHLLGAVGVTAGNAGRITRQKGVASTSAAKAVLTVAALGATAYARVVGKKIGTLSPASVHGVTEPIDATPPELAAAQQQEKVLQWVLPALTGSLVLLSAYMGEQQRPQAVFSGILHRRKPK